MNRLKVWVIFFVTISLSALHNTYAGPQQNCVESGFCKSICGTPGDIACTYAWCDDETGTELCLSGGEQDIPEECGMGIMC